MSHYRSDESMAEVVKEARADERAKCLRELREGAVERVANILDEIHSATQIGTESQLQAFSRRIVSALLGEEKAAIDAELKE